MFYIQKSLSTISPSCLVFTTKKKTEGWQCKDRWKRQKRMQRNLEQASDKLIAISTFMCSLLYSESNPTFKSKPVGSSKPSPPHTLLPHRSPASYNHSKQAMMTEGFNLSRFVFHFYFWIFWDLNGCVIEWTTDWMKCAFGQRFSEDFFFSLFSLLVSLFHVTRNNKLPSLQSILICRYVLVMLCLFLFSTHVGRFFLSDQTNLQHREQSIVGEEG